MDVASSVYSLTTGIIAFISAHDDQQALTNEISHSIGLVQTAIKPLFDDPHALETNKSVLECLRAIQGTLQDLYYHLRLWKESRSHRLIAWVHPATVNQQLKDDRQTLMDHFVILAGATQFADHVSSFNVVTSRSTPTIASLPHTSPSESLPYNIEPKVEPENREVSDFWDHCVGSKTKLERADDFCVDISAHLAIELSPVACKRLLLRLDEKNTGYISYSSLQGLVKQDEMADVIKAYSLDPEIPLLVWIDDNVSGNEPKVLEASRQGITVIQLASTKAAKTWIKINLEYLKAHDNAAEIRFISDQVRVEADDNDVIFENHNAGTEMLQFIREQGLQAPVLIYTDRKSILLTHYVEKDKMAGSLTSHYKVFKDYVAALGAGRTDDTEWKTFDA